MGTPVNAVGTVKWFNTEKGYGFLTVQGYEKDIFLHVKKLRNSGITSNPIEGEIYECIIENGPKGLFATNLTRKAPNANQGPVT